MADVHIRPSVGGGHVQVTAGGSGSHVSMYAGAGGHVRLTQGKLDVVIYDSPGGRTGAARAKNPGLTEVLLGGRLASVVADYTAKVASTYTAMLTARGGTGRLASTVEANVLPYSGYDRDRWVGEVTVGNAATPYGAADEFGRKNPDEAQRGSTTDGSNQLRTALYSVLPYPI